MSVESVVAEGRAAAERRMTSRCTIRRPGASTTGAGGFQVTGWDALYTDLPCRLSGAAGSASPSRAVRVGDVEIQVAARVLHLPAGTLGLRDGDYVEITTGDVAGRAFRIVESTPADQQTAMRVQVLEVERPGEWP